MPAILYLSLW